MPERFAVDYAARPDTSRPTTWDTGQAYAGGFAPPASAPMAVYGGGLSLPGYYGSGGAGYDFLRDGEDDGRPPLEIEATGRYWDPFGSGTADGQSHTLGVFSEDSLNGGNPSSAGHLTWTPTTWELALFWNGTAHWDSVSGVRSHVLAPNEVWTARIAWDYRAGTVTVTPPHGGPETFTHPLVKATLDDGGSVWTRGFVELVGTPTSGGLIPQFLTAEGLVDDPRPARALLTLAQAKQHLNIGGDTSDSELLTYVDAVTDVVESHLGGPVVTRTFTDPVEVVDGGRALLLPRRFVRAVSAITAGGMTVSAGDVVVGSGSVLRRRSGRAFWPNDSPVLATYSAGLADPGAVPSALVLAAAIVIGHLWATQRGGATAGGPGDDYGTVNTVVPGLGFAVPNRALELMSPWAAESGLVLV
jgi:hypothetical protein